MPPKKTHQITKAVAAKQAKHKPEDEDEDEQQQAQTHDENSNHTAKDEADADAKKTLSSSSSSSTNKRKPAPTPTSTSASSSKPAAKRPRRQGTKFSSRGKDSASPNQLLHFLLSPSCLTLCYPDDELRAPSSPSKKYSTTSPAAFTPFEHLLTASLLSKPLSHRLGMRSTRTLLNPPFGFTAPQAVRQAGEQRVWEALEAARTQHRQKTAGYIVEMAQRFADDPDLEEVKRDPMGEVQRVKGMGRMCAELFCRRVQCLDDGWEDVFPFADQKSLEALRELGFHVRNAEELRDVMDRELDWEQVGDVGLSGSIEGDREQKRRVAFVLVLERAIGASLEGNVQMVKKEAAPL